MGAYESQVKSDGGGEREREDERDGGWESERMKLNVSKVKREKECMSVCLSVCLWESEWKSHRE